MYQREFDQKLRIGIVGIGSHMYRNLLPALHHLPVEIVAMCNHSDTKKLESTAREYGCKAYTSTTSMYKNEQLDGVVMSISPQMHPQLAQEAIENGLHVFMEKPPAMRAFQIEQLMQIRGDRVVAVGFKKAFMPAAQKAREVIGDAQYGGLISMLGIYPMTLPQDGALVLKNMQFTNWLGNGCHPLSMMLSCCGKVSAITAHRGSAGQGCVVLEFANGVMGNLHLAQQPSPIESYHFYGGRWSLKIENTDKVILERGIPFEYAYTNNFAPQGLDSGSIVWEPQNCLATLENKSLYLQGMVQELNAYCRTILYGEDLGFASLEFALEVMKVYEAVLLSNGNRVKLD